MAKGDKYINLENYLKGMNKEIIELDFNQVERIVNFKLPTSAYNEDYSWWGNDKTHSQAVSWMNAGYSVSVDFNKQKAIFKRKNRAIYINKEERLMGNNIIEVDNAWRKSK